MRMKYVFATMLVATTLLFTNCGDDDHPVIPKMKKITRIACTQEGTSASWNMDISYNQDGDLYRILYSSAGMDEKDYSELYQYSGNTITETRFVGTVPDINRTYTYSGSVVTAEEEMADLQTVNEYKYTYQGKELTSIVQTTENKETGVTTIPYKFNWENIGNMTLFVYNNTTQLKFTYGSMIHPENFPLKAMKTVDLTDKRFLDPVNLLFNATSYYLPEKAQLVEAPTATIQTIYTFEYETTGDYVTAMTMTVTDQAHGLRTYKYTFSYGYDPN